ncbi:MAG TPA: ribokinase [Candidatus Dormibacteraeota bacterium]|jgi:ribokinase
MGRIVVLGSLNVDLVAQVSHLPAPGETVLADSLQTFPGGKGANQAAGAARLGGSVAMIGRVGNDTFGSMLLKSLTRDGADITGVARDPDAPTGTALILVDPQGENVIAVSPGANANLGADEIRHALDAVDAHGLLVLQLEIPPHVVREAIAGARRKGIRTLLNAAPAGRVTIADVVGLDVLVTNEPETSALVGRPVEDTPAAERAALELHKKGVRLAVVTLGAAGSVFCLDGSAEHVEPFHVTAVDSTAAGDAFVGALAVALSDGIEVPQALRLANAAGAGAASKAGAQSSLPHRGDLERLFGVRWP